MRVSLCPAGLQGAGLCFAPLGGDPRGMMELTVKHRGMLFSDIRVSKSGGSACVWGGDGSDGGAAGTCVCLHVLKGCFEGQAAWPWPCAAHITLIPLCDAVLCDVLSFNVT